eukprot:2397666-Prymnesium_polylepis.1
MPPPSPAAPPKGCTDSTALNFRSFAVSDDSGCIIGGCTDSRTSAYNPAATYDTGVCPPLRPGCTDSASGNFRSLANVADDSCVYAGVSLRAHAWCIATPCTDTTALNYDPSVTVAASCIPIVVGCTHPAATNYFAGANVDSGSCFFAGCTDSTRANYDATATFESGTCEPIFPGCTDVTALNYNDAFNMDDGSCRILGCVEPTDVNYNPRAVVNYGCAGTSAWPAPSQLWSKAHACLPMRTGSRRRLDGVALSGCLDPVASNYASAATINDGACTYAITGCSDSTAINFLSAANVHESALCEFPVQGCTAQTALNFDSRAS